MQRVKYVIIGGGVTGLAFANFINSDDFVILEKEETVGGYCKTVYEKGFIWDYAGHFFHFQDPQMRHYFQERMSSESLQEIVKTTKIYYNGGIVDYPFQKNIHQLDKDEFIDCLCDLYFRTNVCEEENFKEMVYAKFGKSIAEKFLIPYNEKLFACNLSDLDSIAMGRFFPYASVEEIIQNFRHSKENSYNSTFIYPKRGAIQFINALQRDLDESKIYTDEEVIRIHPHDKILETSCRRIGYEYLISTAPFNALLELTGWQGDASNLAWNRVLVFNLGFDSKGPQHIHWMYFPEKDFRFYRVGFYDNILDSERMSIYVETGLSKDDYVDNDVELEKVLRGLKQAGILKDHKLIACHSIILDPAYIHVTTGSTQLFRQVDQTLRALNIYSIGRYGGWKYCSIEDNLIEARHLAESFNCSSYFHHQENHDL